MKINRPTSTALIYIVALLVIFLFVWPKFQEARQLETNVGQRSAEFNGKSLYYKNINALDSDVKARQDVLQKISRALPPTASLSPEVYFFQEAAAQNGLAVKSIVFSQGGMLAGSNGIKSIVLALDLAGSYQGLKNFLRQVEASARIFQVNSISFASLNPLQTVAQQQQSQSYNFKLEVQTSTYWV